MMEEPGGIECLEQDTVSEIRGVPSFEWSVEISDGKAPRKVLLHEGQSLLLGSSSRADIRLEDPAVSGAHGEIGVDRGQLWVRDAGSRNGTYVAGARVPQALFLQEGCFVLGRSLVQVVPGALPEEDLSQEEPLPGLIGRSSAMLRLAREIRRFAPLRLPVLIRGETGSGKEKVATALHQESPRSRSPFIALNMSAFSLELIDSELFGHERGAFTGATSATPGAFLAAQDGTVFLDEIAELPMAAQAKLLRTLENGEVKPVGAAQSKKFQARVVAASWASLQDRVNQGRFREDLFHRLEVLTIRVPPLRERFGDLPLLAAHILGSVDPSVGEKSLTSSALSRLSSHAWPGNVRELHNVLNRAALRDPKTPWITTEHIEASMVPFRPSPGGDEQERAREVQRVLDQHQGNISSAARSMGIARSTLRKWMGKGSPR